MTHTSGPPESCGDCHDGFHPQIGTVAIDPNAIICNLIGDDAISDADRLNPDCPRIEKPQKQPAKAEIVSELAAVKKINADLLEALEYVVDEIKRDPENDLFSGPDLTYFQTATGKARP